MSLPLTILYSPAFGSKIFLCMKTVWTPFQTVVSGFGKHLYNAVLVIEAKPFLLSSGTFHGSAQHRLYYASTFVRYLQLEESKWKNANDCYNWAHYLNKY